MNELIAALHVLKRERERLTEAKEQKHAELAQLYHNIQQSEQRQYEFQNRIDSGHRKLLELREQRQRVDQRCELLKKRIEHEFAELDVENLEAAQRQQDLHRMELESKAAQTARDASRAADVARISKKHHRALRNKVEHLREEALQARLRVVQLQNAWERLCLLEKQAQSEFRE